MCNVFRTIILNTNKIKEKICAEIAYKPVFNIKLFSTAIRLSA